MKKISTIMTRKKLGTFKAEKCKSQRFLSLYNLLNLMNDISKMIFLINPYAIHIFGISEKFIYFYDDSATSGSRNPIFRNFSAGQHFVRVCASMCFSVRSSL